MAQALDLVPVSLSSSAPPMERLVLGRLQGPATGQLELRSEGRTYRFGAPASDGLQARLVVHRPRFFWRVAVGGSLGAAEAFMDGDWSTDDATAVVRWFVRNQAIMSGLEGGLASAGAALGRLWALARANTRAGSRRNIRAHYDLGNDFFERMLDPTMMYSAALFDSPEATLEQASTRKLERLCDKLALRAGDHLLEIGSGWGGMAIHAARHHGCRVTTTTISRAQAEYARARIRAAGLEDRITLLERDYRDLDGRFDKIVSIEMIEAIGAAAYPTFFRKCASLLVPGGRLALQTITIRDQVWESHVRQVDFIKRYIFPGSSIPSIGALTSASGRASDLVLADLEDLTSHYARTLAEWRANLAPHRAEVVAAYGERFWRMWDYYLSYCEAGFRERYLGSTQLVFDRAGGGP